MDESQIKLLFTSASALVAPRKLDTALRNTTTKAFIHRLKNNALKYQDLFFLKSLKCVSPDLDVTQIPQNKPLWPLILSKILEPEAVDSKFFKTSWRQLMRVSKSALNVQLMYNKVSDHRAEATLINLMSVEKEFADLVVKLGATGGNINQSPMHKLQTIPPHCNWECKRLDLKAVFGLEVCLVEFSKIQTLLPSSYILLMHNKLCDIISVLLYAWFSEGVNIDDQGYGTTIEFIKVCCNEFRVHKDKAYSIFKVLEGIGIGLTLVEVDGTSNSSFYTSILDSLGTELDVEFTNNPLLDILKRASIPFRHELMCLSKIFGHPFVDMKAGAEQLHYRTTSEKRLDSLAIHKSVCYAAKSYVKSYLKRHGTWPPCEVNSAILSKARKMNTDPDSTKFVSKNGITPIEEYYHIEFEQTMTFNMCDNTISHLKHKTISILRSDAIKHYLSEDNGPPVQWQNTRLLLYYLLNKKSVTDHVSYLKHYLDLLPPEERTLSKMELMDQLIIRLVPKEKELKKLFRGFGCKTTWERMRTLAQEKSMELYCSEQAMTLNELDILHKLMSFRRTEKAFVGYKPLYLNLDSTGWNNAFRTETVRPIMEKVYDPIFGTAGLQETMVYYENSWIVVPDEFITYSWDGQYGGIEGLNQDTWDLTYLPQIHYALEGCGFEYLLFVKGDDLRVVLMIPPKVLETTTREEIRVVIVNQVTERMKSFGHQLNATESYASSTYLAFSKSASVGMIELPQAYRKIQKTYGANNAFLPFLDDFIGAAFSNAHSACKVTVNPLPCYVVALVWTYMHILRNRNFSNCTDAQLVTLSVTPSLMGGFPIIYLHNMWTRAESDLLSPYLDLLMFLRGYFPDLYEAASAFLRFQVITNSYTGSFILGLLMDCYSLPIKKPVTASSVLRQSIGPALQRIIVHEEIKELFKAAASDEMMSLVRTLESSNVYFSFLIRFFRVV